MAAGDGDSQTSGGLGTYTFSYTASNNTPYVNYWNTKTVVTNPDGSTDTVYTNYIGEVMLDDHHDLVSGSDTDQFYVYNSLGQLSFAADPSAITGYSDTYADLLHYQSGGYQDLSPNSGLITHYEYYSTTTATETTAGSVTNYLQEQFLAQGQQGAPVYEQYWTYYAHAFKGQNIAAVAAYSVFRNDNDTGTETTSYTYSWYNDTAEIQSATESDPVITYAENGPDVADVTTTYFDPFGNVQWIKDADGFLQYYAYDLATGAQTTQIIDVNTTDSGEFTNLPTGWSTPSGGGLNLITTDAVDALGRTTEEISPNGNITYYVYLDPEHEERIYLGWNSSTGTPTEPTEVIREDAADGYEETFTMMAAPNVTNGAPDGTEAISGLLSLTRDYMNDAGQVVYEDDYFNLSGLAYSTGPMGTANVNYYQTLYGYDSDGNLVRTVTPNGTIYRTVYNSLGEAMSDWVGTNDTPTSGEWSPTNNTGTANMVMVASYQYDIEGNLTQETDYPGLGAAAEVTQYWYDWRNRLVAQKSGVESNEDDGVNRPIIVYTYDNLDEVTETQQYEGDGVTPQIVNGVLQALPADDLRAQEIDSYDNQQRLYQTQVYDVNPTNGTVSSSALTTNYYYDHRGDLMAEADPGGLWTKSQYDGADRDVMDYTTDGAYGTYWVEAATATHDTVLEQEQTVYDADSNVIETIDSQRFDNAVGTGPLGTPTSGIGARVYYTADYYDNADRLTAEMDVGTNNGNAWTPPSTPPTSSPWVLTTTYAYNSMGLVQDVTDPMGIDTRTLYDNLGRVTKTIEHYTDGTETTDSNIATQYGYDGDNNVIYVQADQPGGSSQKTAYVYGVTTVAGDGINSNDMLSAILHPDPTSGQPSHSEQESYLVNALGQTVQFSDRAGNVHQYSYDVLGRETADAVTTLGAGVDGSVRRIEYGYDSQGNQALVTSYDAASGGNIVNQVQDVYNGLGQLTGEYQAHSGAVNTLSTPEVQYAYTELQNGNNSRLTSMTYPDGYVLNYNYNTGLDSNISRLSSISDASNTLESYKYLGLDTVVERDHEQTGVNQTYISQNGQTGSAGDQYVGLNRFGEVVNDNWVNASTGQSTDDFAYGYDEDGDVLYKQNLVDAVMSELYQYNNLHELIGYQQGTLNSSDNGIVGTPTASQSWSPDALGNFTSVQTGDSTRNETFNQQNQITSISDAGAVAYDANGNLTADGSGTTYVYNAWNELVAVKTGGRFVVASYSYDGLGRRIVATGMSMPTTDLYYSSADQVLEEDASGVTQARNVWSIVYVNALVLRDQSSQHDGVLDQRLYVQQDANWNVTALVSPSGTVLERYAYSPYGTVTVLSSTWVVQSDTNYRVPYLWQGMEYEWATNLIFADARVYIPALMVWMQTDPLGLNAGDNDYEPEDDGPTDGLDPSGLDRLEYGRSDRGRQAVYYIRTGYTIFGTFDKSPVFIGYLDPNTNEVERKGYSVALATLQSEVNGWFYTTYDWDAFFSNKGTAVTNDGNDPRLVGLMAMQARAGVSATRNERAAVNEQYVKPLVKTAVLHNAGAGFNASPSRFAGRLPGGVKCPPNCFPPDTLVGTESGLRPIAQIEPGERLWAYDFLHGSWRLCVVECRHDNNYVGPLVTLHTDVGKVTATAYHPFWVIQGEDLTNRPDPHDLAPREDQDGCLPGRWVNSHDLREGDIIALRDRGSLTVRRLTQRHAITLVCNLTVQELHTFAVGGMQTLVHNTSASIQALIDEAAELGIGIERLEIQGGVARMRISQIFNNSSADFAKLGQVLRQQGVRQVVVDSGPVVARELATRYRSIAARGGTIRGGGRIRLVSETPSSIPGREGEMIPTFEIVYDLP